ncbi:MAG: hypothetical protein ABF649_01175 [Bacillus sp. (in: firmicutes)]
MENLVEEKKKPFNFFQRIVLVFVIPTVFAMVVLVLLMIYSGTDVMEKGKELANHIPFLRTEETTDREKQQDSTQTILDLETKLSEQKEEISKLQSELETSEKESKTVQVEKEKLQKELETLQKEQEETEKKFNDIVKTYETMSAKSSAAIIEKMNDQEGLKILAALKPATLAPILEKMEPEIASKYTEQLSKTSTSSDLEANSDSSNSGASN